MSVRVQVEWPLERTLEPAIMVIEPALPFDEVRIDVPLALAYRWLDAQHDATPPPPESVLLPAQRALLDRFEQDWPRLQRAIAAHYPPEVRPHLHWGALRVTDRVRDEQVVWEVEGVCSAPFATSYDEHGLGAVLLGDTVLAAGERDPQAALPPAYKPRVAPRAHPDYRSLDAQEIEGFLQARDFKGLEAAVSHAHGTGPLREVVLHWLLGAPVDEALACLPRLARWIVRYPGWNLDEDMLRFDAGLLRELVALGCYVLPAGALHDAEDPGMLRRWAEVGASVDAEVYGLRPLDQHRARPAMFEALLELGADPACLFDEYGDLIGDLGAPQRAALEQHHPGLLPAAPASPATGLLADWLQHEWIELEPGADELFLDRLLTGILSRTTDPERIVDALLQVPGVEDVYVDDETLMDWLAERGLE